MNSLVSCRQRYTVLARRALTFTAMQKISSQECTLNQSDALSHLQKKKTFISLLLVGFFFIGTWWGVLQEKLMQVGVVITWCDWCQLGTIPRGCTSMWVRSPWVCISPDPAEKCWGCYWAGTADLASLSGRLSAPSFVITPSVQKYCHARLVLRTVLSKINIQRKCYRLLLHLNEWFNLREERFQQWAAQCTRWHPRNKWATQECAGVTVEIEFQSVFSLSYSLTHTHTHFFVSGNFAAMCRLIDLSGDWSINWTT